MTPGPYVAIYELTREWTTYRWLCEACLAATKAEGWTVKYRAPAVKRASSTPDEPPEYHACDRCPAIPSPHLKPDGSVAYLPTTRAARLPTRAECPPPRALPPWPKPKGWKQQKPKVARAA